MLFCFPEPFGTFPVMKSRLSILKAGLVGRSFLGAVVLAVALSGCERDLTTTEQSTLIGTGVGSGVGVIVGGAVGAPGEGLAVGAVSGGAIGAYVGNEAESSEERTLQMQEVVRRQQEELKRQEREIEDLRRQRGYNDYLLKR
jgi:hypothetical protein